MGVGERIKQAREAKGYSRLELAEILEVTSSAISNYENGISHSRIEILYQAMNVLEVDANFIFQDEMRSDIPSLSPAAQQIARLYDNADERTRRIVDVTLGFKSVTGTVERPAPKQEHTDKIFRAARSDNNAAPEILDVPEERIRKLEDAPEADEI